MWGPENSTLPDTSIAVATLSVRFTSLDSKTQLEDQAVGKAVYQYVSETTGYTKDDYKFRIADGNTSFWLPWTIMGQTWAPPDLVPGDCKNDAEFVSYFVGKNITIVKSIKKLFELPSTGQSPILQPKKSQQGLFLTFLIAFFVPAAGIQDALDSFLPAGTETCNLDIEDSNFVFVPARGKPSIPGGPGSTYGLGDVPSLALADSETGQPLSYVVKGDVYTLDLAGFETGATVNLVASLSTGVDLPIGTIPSFVGKEMTFPWTVSSSLSPGTLVSIKGTQLNNPLKVGYTPLLTVEAAASQANINRYLKHVNFDAADYHPSIPDTVNRMRRLLSSRLVTSKRAVI